MAREVETGPGRERVDATTSLTIEANVTERHGLFAVDVSEQNALHPCWLRMRVFLNGRMIHGSGRDGRRIRSQDVRQWFLSGALEFPERGNITAIIYTANGEPLNVRGRLMLDELPIDQTQFE